MKLNPDCIRDILFVVEEITSPSEAFIYSPANVPESLNRYTPDEIVYHAGQCSHLNLIRGYKQYIGGSFAVLDLTPEGHEFLGNIRSETVWNKVKESVSKAGTISLNILTDTIAKIVSELISRGIN